MKKYSIVLMVIIIIRSPGWRIYGGVEDTKFSTNKQHTLSIVMIIIIIITKKKKVLNEKEDFKQLEDFNRKDKTDTDPKKKPEIGGSGEVVAEEEDE